jgi:hypothetical protein
MTIDATVKDAKNAGATKTEVKVILTVPKDKITMNPNTNQPKARMFATPGQQYVTQYNPQIVPTEK